MREVSARRTAPCYGRACTHHRSSHSSTISMSGMVGLSTRLGESAVTMLPPDPAGSSTMPQRPLSGVGIPTPLPLRRRACKLGSDVKQSCQKTSQAVFASLSGRGLSVK
jgi:hypothetical protein